MAKKQVNIRLEEKTVDQLKQLVQAENLWRKKLAEKHGLEIQEATKTSVMEQLINSAFAEKRDAPEG